MTFYSNLQATATRLIAKYGKTASLERRDETTNDPWNPAITTATLSITLVETGYSLTHRESVIQSGDKLGIVEVSEPPLTSDVLILEGNRYHFVDIKPVSPGSTTLLYEFQARR